MRHRRFGIGAALCRISEPRFGLKQPALPKRGGRLIVLDMQPHQRTEYRTDLGHTWLGFQEKQLRDWMLESSWKPIRWQPLPPDPEAKGPNLFVMTAVKNRIIKVFVRHSNPMVPLVRRGSFHFV